MRIPAIINLETAITLYYEKIELHNQDIKKLFGSISSATVAKLKKIAQQTMVQDGVESWNAAAVNTKAAYKSWGLNIDDLEARYKKLKQLRE